MLLIFSKCLTHSSLQGPFLILFRMKVLSISPLCGIQKAVLNLLTSSLLPLPPSPVLIGQLVTLCFDNLAGKESVCNSGDPDLIPGLGRSTGDRIGYPLQHSWASIVAQLVKNPPAMWETWVQCLGWEDPLQKKPATHSSILAWRISWTGEFHGVAKSRTQLSDFYYFVFGLLKSPIIIIQINSSAPSFNLVSTPHLLLFFSR